MLLTWTVKDSKTGPTIFSGSDNIVVLIPGLPAPGYLQALIHACCASVMGGRYPPCVRMGHKSFAFGGIEAHYVGSSEMAGMFIKRKQTWCLSGKLLLEYLP